MARSQLGVSENPPGSNCNKYTRWYGMGCVPWCDIWVSWVAAQVGATDIIGRFAYTPSHYNWFRAKGQTGSTPKSGALAFFDFPDSLRRIQHVGFVEGVRSDSRIVTLEGNTSVTSQDNGGKVMRRVRSGLYVVGYAYPDYERMTVVPKTLAWCEGCDIPSPKGKKVVEDWCNAKGTDAPPSKRKMIVFDQTGSKARVLVNVYEHEVASCSDMLKRAGASTVTTRSANDNVVRRLVNKTAATL